MTHSNPQPLDAAEIAAITGRLEAATPRPWRIVYDGDTWEDGHSEEWPSYINGNGSKEERVVDLEESDNLEANAAFIANAPADIAALLAEVARLAAENARLRRVVVAADNLIAGADHVDPEWREWGNGFSRAEIMMGTLFGIEVALDALEDIDASE